MDRRLVPWIAVAGLALGVAGVAASHRSSRAVATVPRRIALIGDSYAVGLGPELAKLLPNFSAAGRVGSNTTEWASWLPGWLTTYQPTLTLVSLGVNDGNAPNGTNYHAIVSALHGVGSNVVWIEPPAGVNAPAIRAMIESLGVPIVRGAQVQLAADGLHPVAYFPWAAVIARAIS